MKPGRLRPGFGMELRMNVSKIRLGAALFVFAVSSLAVLGYDYKVSRPSNELRPQWSGARAGVWTMDYVAAAAKAKANGKLHIMMFTGSWWCPYCQNFENKVLLSDAWKNFIAEKGCYISMLDYPYRFPVETDQLYKSKYPGKGDGWGFLCWLYDDDYLAENNLTPTDAFKAIQRMYEKQGELADPNAEQFTMNTWDGSSTFTYGKVAYPMLVVYLPDGTEAGRLLAQSNIYRMSAEEAQSYVISQLEEIVSSALDGQCGLCTDPEADECGFTGARAQRYLGWLSDADGVVGQVEVRTSKMSRKGLIKVKTAVSMGGHTVRMEAYTSDGCSAVQAVKRGAPDIANLKIGAYGLSGSYTDGKAEYQVTGARDVFPEKSGDPEVVARQEALKKGVWGLVMKPKASENPLLGGFGTMTVDVRAKGKVRVKGRLGDGTSVDVSGRIIAGDEGVSCLPVVANLYSGKRGGFGCLLWFRNGWLINVTGVSPWRSIRKDVVTTLSWSPVYTALPGPGTVADEMELLFNTPPESLKGLPLVKDPEADTIRVNGTKWRGTDQSSFNARFSAKTSVFSGTMVFYSQRANGNVVKNLASVYGVALGGTGYGTVSIKHIGNWAVKVSACAACED